MLHVVLGRLGRVLVERAAERAREVKGQVMTDERDHYECDGGCGCGVCSRRGELPYALEHYIWNPDTGHLDKLCGRYTIFTGPCEDDT